MKKKILRRKFIFFSIESIVYKFASILTINCKKIIYVVLLYYSYGMCLTEKFWKRRYFISCIFIKTQFKTPVVLI